MPASYSPPAIYAVWYAIHREISRSTLSGILGDAAHFAEGGYHVPRHYVASGDYSVQLPQDRKGDAYAASALDVSYPPDLMKTVSQRLLTAGKGNDPRLASMREFFGSVDGVKVIGWDRHNPDSAYDDTPTTSDPSHLWHVHISFYREHATDEKALLPVADVVTGKRLIIPATDPNWSDLVDKAQVQQAAVDAVQDKIDDALRAHMFGDDGALHKRAPGIYPDKAHGVDDRLKKLEQK